MLARRVWLPMAVTIALASPSTTNVPAWSASPTSMASGTLSPVSIDVSSESMDASVAVRSAETRSPASSSTRSPTTRSTGVDLAGATIADDGRHARQEIAQALGSTLGAMLLGKREQPVEDDDDDDRDGELRHPGQEGQSGRAPQHDGEEVKELAGQHPPGRRRRRTRQDVRAVTSAA